MKILLIILFAFQVQAGVVVTGQDKVLTEIKANTNAAASVPALRDQVALLTDELQKLKDEVREGKEPKDD